MVQFTRLRLSGFKSFVDSTEVPIEEGLTGVVGPNGCGKSNLVEALKWVMGETSARQMRGGEMDDVIFGGTANRPARNLAEVTVYLDNAARTAPAMFNDHAELEVTRRIERGLGSVYRVNGREVRARDVQLLFADAATGARSTALVSQGRVGLLINAKPSERRSLLEEAAGIGGLHSRRHEAEIRLKGAEANLERLTDVLSALDGQLQNLKKQARQAARYRALSDQIRKAEAVVLHLGWVAAIRTLEEARARLAEAESRVASLTGGAAAAATAQAEAAASLPALRQAEAEAAARLQRLVLAREQLDAEAGRIAAARRESETRRSQIIGDLAREEARAADAAEALSRLETERLDLEGEAGTEDGAREDATLRLREVGAAVNAAEAELVRLTDLVAAAEARRTEAARRAEDLAARVRRLAARVAEMEAGRATLAAALVPPEELAAAEERLGLAVERVDAARAAADAADLARREAEAAVDRAREDLSRDTAARAKLAAETSALEEMLAEGGEGDWPALIDEVTVVQGYEAAVAAALGDDLLASVDAGAPRHWNELPPLETPPPLPEGAESLARRLTAPPALARRLTQVGLVASGAAARRLWSDLAPGQRLVTRDGGLWRWDGFAVVPGAPSAAATRLKQRNRLADLEVGLAEADARVEDAARRLDEVREAAERAAAAERRGREEGRAADTALSAAREAVGRLEQKATAAASRLAAADETLARARGDLAEAEAEAARGLADASEAADPAEGRQRVAELRAEVAEGRTALLEARTAYDRLTREADARRQRLEAIAGEAESWRRRGETATLQKRELEERRDAVTARLERLAARPLEMEEQRRTLLDQSHAAEAARRDMADRLAQAESVLVEADRRLRDADQVLSAAREDRVRADAAVEQGRQACRTVAGRIAERLDCTPEQAVQLAALPEGEALPVLEEAERRLERLSRERETMGPVNLRAEQEAADLEQQITTLQGERDDLVAAIARLRQGIAEINREGRERLLASFAAVDQHFRDLFVRLFGGGRAHLTLTESDDPLQAGLEIMASPPGKRLQILSLLSGGEQALTALALLFAVFLTNPAPVCVLDEVDAPLDDANVDRFCTMLAEIAGVSATRFLVVTHHRLTMARVDRLFGVTMGERGVSQLVSVDLRAAEHLRESVLFDFQ
ncbi:MAG: chromosome segregation protein SMC [Alphaproteobacteria bacterium]